MAGKITKESKFNVTLNISETVTQLLESTRYNGDDTMTQDTRRVINVELFGATLNEIKSKIDSLIEVENAYRTDEKNPD